MNASKLLRAGGVPVALLLLMSSALAQAPKDAAPAPDGAALYARRCATCHDHARAHVPARAALANRSATNIVMAMKTGAMQPQAAGLTTEEARAIASFLTAAGGTRDAGLHPNLCLKPLLPLHLAATGWSGWGRDLTNSRFQPDSGITAASVRHLKLKWAFAYPGLMTWGQPTVMGGRVFTASTTGQIYALDALTGCTVWSLEVGAPVRTAISVSARSDGHAVVYFGDTSAKVHAVDADTGTQLWSARADEHPLARITGAPVLFGDRLLVPVSSYEEGAAGAAAYACCTFRGSVLALDPATGRTLWKRSTIAEQPRTYRRAGGLTDLSGPAGGAVWDAPTIDPGRGVLYVGTGNDYTDISSSTTDAVLAIRLEDGQMRWVRQLDLHDSWASGCAFGGPCPEPAGLDADFAASTILVTVPSGREVLVAGQKSGDVYGLDPDEAGKELWHTKVGSGGIFGGIEWGMAAMDGTVFVAISDSLTSSSAAPRPGLAALDAQSGKQLWWTPAPQARCSWGEEDCRHAQSQAVTAIPGLVFSGSQDGHLRAYEAHSGRIVWDLDTARRFPAVNSASAHGGSLDGGGPVLADGVIYVNSGYGQFLGRGGNVLLALSVDGQ